MSELPLDEDGYPDPEALTKEQLVSIVQALQGILWGNDDDANTPDPNKAWRGSTIERVADTLSEYGLKPSDERDK